MGSSLKYIRQRPSDVFTKLLGPVSEVAPTLAALTRSPSSTTNERPSSLIALRIPSAPVAKRRNRPSANSITRGWPYPSGRRVPDSTRRSVGAPGVIITLRIAPPVNTYMRQFPSSAPPLSLILDVSAMTPVYPMRSLSNRIPSSTHRFVGAP